MSFTGALLDGWQLPAVSSPPGVAELLLGEPFGGLDEGLTLAAGSSYDTNLSAGFLDGSPWLETGAHAHAEEQVAAVGRDHLAVAPVHVLAGPGVDTTSAALIPGSDEWRCLGGCAQPCSRCVPPPPQEEVGNYQLVGERGAKNGEKLLRHGLVRCPEWSNVSMRSETAAKALAAGDSVLHDLLVEHNSAKLRKPQLIHLCRLWRYSSHVWKRRGVPRNANAETSAMPGEAHATRSRLLCVGAAVPREPSNQLITGPALAQSLQLALASAVTPHVHRSLPHVQGVEAHRNALVIACTIDMGTRARDAQAAAEMLGRIRLSVRAKRLALHDWARSVQNGRVASVASATYAWQQLCGEDGIAESLMRMLTTVWGAALQDSKRNEAQVMHGQSDVHPAVARWFVETQSGISIQLEWLAAAQALLAPFKCGELSSYVIASDAVMEAIEQACREVGIALASRRAWFEAFLREIIPHNAGELPQMRSMPVCTQAVHRLLEVCGAAERKGSLAP